MINRDKGLIWKTGEFDTSMLSNAYYCFELIEETDIQNIEELYIDNKNKVIGESELKCWVGRNLDITLGNKINEIIKAFKQLDNKINNLQLNKNS